MTYLTHKQVFTNYLRNAPRDGRTIVTDWTDWKDQEGIAQCEECKLYGDYGSEIRTEGDGEILLCNECHIISNLNLNGIVTKIKKTVNEITKDESYKMFNIQEVIGYLNFKKEEVSINEVTEVIEKLYKKTQKNSIWFVV